MEAFEAIKYLSDFSSLNAAQLEEEIENCTKEIEKIENEIETKVELVQLLDDEINNIKSIVEDLENKAERLQVDQIRIITQFKKTQKNIQRMNVDSSRTKLDATDNDKSKLALLKTKLSLLSKLLNVYVNSENEGFVMNPRQMNLQIFQLDMNKPREENREILWNNIGKCSDHLETWEQLFTQ